MAMTVLFSVGRQVDCGNMAEAQGADRAFVRDEGSGSLDRNILDVGISPLVSALPGASVVSAPPPRPEQFSLHQKPNDPLRRH